MKQMKLLNKLNSFFNLNERTKNEQKTNINHLLKKLKIKENKLKEEFDGEKNAEKRKRFQQRLDVIYAQRKKCIILLRDPQEATL